LGTILGILVGMSNSLGLLNFIQIAPIQADCDVISIFQDCGGGIAILLSVSFCNLAQLKRSNCIRNTKFRGYISIRCRRKYIEYIDVAEILLLSVYEKETDAITKFYLEFRFSPASSSLCHSVHAYQILSKSDHPQPSYDVIAIFKMATPAS